MKIEIVYKGDCTFDFSGFPDIFDIKRNCIYKPNIGAYAQATEELLTEDKKITINKIKEIPHDKWIYCALIANPKRIYSTKVRINGQTYQNRYVYLIYYENNDKNKSQREIYIALRYWQNQRFLWIQKDHWLQKKMVVNLEVLIGIISIFVTLWCIFK